MLFAFLPPEINSARMYAGPGSSSLLIAAGSWDALATELETTAQTFESVITNLVTLQWSGPTSTLMATAAGPYVGWLRTAAEQTKQTALQARTAADAFEQAYTMTVPPSQVLSNRALLMILVATNTLGQNTAAIATAEEQYAEMWARDAMAMYGYSTKSAAATQLPAFTTPPQSTNLGGLVAQSAVVAQAAAVEPGTIGAQLAAAVPPLLSGLPFNFTGDFGVLDAIASVYASVTCTSNISGLVRDITGTESDLGMLPAAAAELAPGLTTVPASGGLLNTIFASTGRANSIGPLSVPASWSVPATHSVSALSPAGLTTFGGTEEAAGPGVPGVPGMPAATGGRSSGVLPRYGVRLTVMGRPPAAG